MAPHQEIADLRYLSYAEWISGDYNEFVKKTVLPQFKKKYPLKLRETRVLNAIASSERAPSATYISDVLRQDPATITRSLVILIGNGYVVSEEDYNDGRSRLLKTTPYGAEAARHFLDIFRQIVGTAKHSSNAAQFNHDHNMLTESLQLVASRAKAFKESQRMLRRSLNTQSSRAFN
jgi:DNA-binding MarR family transcriptional regulator